MSIVQHLINGELVTKGERTADVFNPSTGQAVRKVELQTHEGLYTVQGPSKKTK